MTAKGTERFRTSENEFSDNHIKLGKICIQKPTSAVVYNNTDVDTLILMTIIISEYNNNNIILLYYYSTMHL